LKYQRNTITIPTLKCGNKKNVLEKYYYNSHFEMWKQFPACYISCLTIQSSEVELVGSKTRELNLKPLSYFCSLSPSIGCRYEGEKELEKSPKFLAEDAMQNGISNSRILTSHN
jgi:hypothetical protein